VRQQEDESSVAVAYKRMGANQADLFFLSFCCNTCCTLGTASVPTGR
jgi:hypothetical protein